MTIEDHNHFCIYCGERLAPGQNFCTQCGKPVIHDEIPVKEVPSKYKEMIDDLEQKYNLKQARAKELVNKLFDPTHMSYDKFLSSINKSNDLFENQVVVARKMMELDDGFNAVVKRELEIKIKTLQSFIDKMDDLINELVIQLSSNKRDNDEINNLFKDMDDLIHSVKDY